MASLTSFQPFNKDAFKALIASIYTYGPVIWEGEPRKFPGPLNGKPGELLEMDMVRVKTLGTEDVTKVWDSVSQAMDITYSSASVYTISLRVESFSFDYPAYDRLSEVCLLLRRKANLSALNNINLGYALHYDIVPVKLIADERPLYCAECDVLFNGLNIEEDDSETGGIVETIGGWSGPAGAPGALPGTVYGLTGPNGSVV